MYFTKVLNHRTLFPKEIHVQGTGIQNSLKLCIPRFSNINNTASNFLLNINFGTYCMFPTLYEHLIPKVSSLKALCIIPEILIRAFSLNLTLLDKPIVENFQFFDCLISSISFHHRNYHRNILVHTFFSINKSHYLNLIHFIANKYCPKDCAWNPPSLSDD